ncbi:MAG: AIR synthase-related protein, partial [Candidatus Omnitrophota bacterium]
TRLGLLRACHDLSEGGIACALAEMAFSGGFGIEAELKNCTCNLANLTRLETADTVALFSESNTRFIVEVRKKDKKAFEGLMKGIPIGLLGKVSGKKDFKVYGLSGKKIVDTSLDKLKEAWQKPLRW